ncbi:MAG: contractile injection system tape measure protein [Alkalilacustris sp.]
MAPAQPGDGARAPTDPVLRLAAGLAGDAPLAGRGLLEALALVWAALPAALAGQPQARAAYLSAVVRIAAAPPGAADMAALCGAVHDLFHAAGHRTAPAGDAGRRLAARTVLARLQHAGAGSARARALARAAMAAVFPELTAESPGAAAGLSSRVAGLVLLAPHLRTLFQRGGVLAATGGLPPDRLGRALGLLELCSGRPEGPADPLERVLLGLPPGQPLQPDPPDDDRAALVDGLLRAVVAQWGALGRTSPEGLREAFLRRDGDLTLEEGGAARLRVAAGPFDMLLDRLPWSVALVRLPWMAGPLHVRWRGHGER